MAMMRRPLRGIRDDEPLPEPQRPDRLTAVEGGKDKGAIDPGILGGNIPGIPGPDFSRGGETPRERQPDVALRQVGGSTATPPTPKAPTPMAGSTAPATGASQAMGPIPFQPMASPIGSLLRTQGGSMYGSLGGLKGGGLGIPLDPISDEASDPITTLISMLKGGRG